MRRTLFCALATVSMGLGVMGIAAGAAASPAPITARAAAPEHQCGGTTKMADDYGRKANVNSCVDTDGQFMTVTAPADCFYAYGAKQYAGCNTIGSWTMSQSGQQVAAGNFDALVAYPGPGTYQIIGTVRARGSEGTSGFTVSGTTTKTFTLTSAQRLLPVGIQVVQGPAVNGATPVTFTLSHNDASAGYAKIQFVAGTSATVQSQDSRCKQSAEPYIGYVTVCRVDQPVGQSSEVNVTVTKCISWKMQWGYGRRESVTGKVGCA
jgi:hypothetical protein